jgi:hypothetical protein
MPHPRGTSTAGQLAIVAGRAWKRAEGEGRVQKQGTRTDLQPLPKANKGLIADPRKYFADAHGVGKNYIGMAKLIVDQGPEDLASPVSRGSAPRLKVESRSKVVIEAKCQKGAF